MRIKVKCSVSAILLMLMVFVVMGMNTLSEGRYGEGTRSITQPQTTIYINGSWNITTDTVRSNETIILSGNLTVSNNASLTFKNVTLIMNCTSAGQYVIEVKPGSSMYILDLDNNNVTTDDTSNITAADANYPYLFWVDDGTHFEMRNSKLHRCGGFGITGISPVTKTYGLHIQTDNATIDHNLISDNYMGIVLYGSDATISNNTITWNDDTGIFSGYWSNGTIENNWITWNYDYGIYVTGGGSTGTKPSNPMIIGNVITDTGRGTNTADGIQVLYGSKPLIRNTIILRSKEDGLYSDSSTPTLINVTIDAGGIGNYGIVGSSTGYLYVINSTIKNSKIYDLSANSNSYFVVINSTFGTSECYNSGANITVKWYLNVYVRDSNLDPIPAANVRIRDNENGTYDRNFTTDNNGYVKWITLTEYMDENISSSYTNRTYYTPYNISVNYTGLNFSDNPRNSTINTSKTEVFTATPTVPEFDSILIPIISVIVIVLSFFRKKKNRYK